MLEGMKYSFQMKNSNYQADLGVLDIHMEQARSQLLEYIAKQQEKDIIHCLLLALLDDRKKLKQKIKELEASR